MELVSFVKLVHGKIISKTVSSPLYEADMPLQWYISMVQKGSASIVPQGKICAVEQRMMALIKRIFRSSMGFFCAIVIDLVMLFGGMVVSSFYIKSVLLWTYLC